MNLILDMDETLINYKMFPRPYLEEFLTECFKIFSSLSIWTNANEEWFNMANNNIFKPLIDIINEKEITLYKFHFVFTREKYKNKKLRRLHNSKTFKQFNINNMIIIDDTKENFTCNYGNGIQIIPFCNFYNDSELLKLLKYFKKILIPYFKENNTILSLDKRLWRLKI